MPVSACSRTTSPTAVRTRAASSGAASPRSCAVSSAARSPGRGRLPVCVVRMRLITRAYPAVRVGLRSAAMQLEWLGRLGIFSGELASFPTDVQRRVVSELEVLGYGTIWYGEAFAREPFVQGAIFLAATERMVATGHPYSCPRTTPTSPCADTSTGGRWPPC